MNRVVYRVQVMDIQKIKDQPGHPLRGTGSRQKVLPEQGLFPCC